MSTAPEPTASCRDYEDPMFDAFCQLVAATFLRNVADFGPSLFLTDARDLSKIWLSCLPVAVNKQHDCRACLDFIDEHGGLVCIDSRGVSRPALWPSDDDEGCPLRYRSAASSLHDRVAYASVKEVFFSDAPVWGKPTTGPWSHLAVLSPDAFKKVIPGKSAGQSIDVKLVDYTQVLIALSEFRVETLDTAVSLLSGPLRDAGTHVAGPVRWLRDLHVSVAQNLSRVRANKVWKAVASAPEGFCHVRTSSAGALLTDVQNGLEFGAIRARLAAKMNPLTRMRAQAPPSPQNVVRAENLFAELGLARSLERRFARLDEIEAVWRPPVKKESRTAGVFSHLFAPKYKGRDVLVPTQAITWAKFHRTVLPEAESIEYLVEPRNAWFGAVTTAVHADAPPILQWDLPTRRNPASFYLYAGGSPPQRWNLTPRTWVKVNAVSLKPCHWGPDHRVCAHHAPAALFVLDGARDLGVPPTELFPSTLKSELHEVRDTIEAFCKTRTIADSEHASACGIQVPSHLAEEVHLSQFRVCTKATVVTYVIDRWE